MNKVFVIIVTYYAEKWIDKFMKSIQNSTVKSQTIIVDNSSQDSTVDLIKSNYPEVELIVNNKNLGFGAANNIGIKKALDSGAEYVFLLNQDAWVEANTFEKLIDIASKYPEYGILSPIQQKEQTYDRLFLDMITMGRYKYDLISDMMNGNIKDCYPVEFVQAAGWLITKQCLTEVDYSTHYSTTTEKIQITPNEFGDII